jgi:hypothetical protein
MSPAGLVPRSAGAEAGSVTLQLLWEECRADHVAGYGYSLFCDLCRDWRKTMSATMRADACRRREAVRRMGGRHGAGVRHGTGNAPDRREGVDVGTDPLRQRLAPGPTGIICH